MFGLPIQETSPEQWNQAPELWCAKDEPYVVKGLVESWPLVKAARQGESSTIEYLKQFNHGALVDLFRASPEYKGRFFYNDDFSGFNFERCRLPLEQVLNTCLAGTDDSIYVGSTSVEFALPGLMQQNPLSLPVVSPLASIWMGTPSVIAAHFDAPDNIACVGAGRRTFTLFPPEQIKNLYIGPLDVTPAGQAISLVDFSDPDFDKFPNFRKAIDAAFHATLGPGDAIFIPSVWWHHVQSLDTFNVLINFWWRNWPIHGCAPMDALLHGMLGVRSLPSNKRAAWQSIFQHYLFDAEQQAHIPEHRQGILGELNDDRARQLRTLLSNHLRR